MPGSLSPPNHTPLVALPAASLDLETTGLDVRRDRIVQLGLVALTGGTILDTPRIDRHVDPEVPIPEAATRITGIRDEHVAGAPVIAELIVELRAALAGRIVVGHHIAFDLAVLRHEAYRVGAEWSDPPALDIGHLVGALAPGLPDLGLETVAGYLGVTISGRHTALGDSMAVAQVFSRLLPLLRDADIRTLGEAMSLIARRQNLVQQEVAAGWHAVPGEKIARPAAAPRARVDSYVFSRILGDVMSAPPVFIAGEASLIEASREMTRRRIGALLVGDPAAPPAGIVTERDLLRALSTGEAALAGATVASVMSMPVESLEHDELLYRALARMDRKKFRHLCVTNGQGIAIGMISQRDLLHHRARSLMIMDDAIAEAADPAGLALALSRIPEVASGLVADHVGGVDIARVVSRELCAVTHRAADLAIQRLAAAGRGGPPAPWCLFVLGSAGRGESLLAADQDNALIHTGGSGDDAWFASFGALIADLLDEAGIPRCTGGVMAANDQWRGSSAAWRERIEHWLRRARPEDLLNVDIFFDLQPVAGEMAIGKELHSQAVAAAAGSRPFLALLGRSVAEVAPRFGLLGRPRTENGRQDLKRNGLLPLVSFARALALRIGATARSTPERIAQAAAAGRIGERDAKALADVHGRLLGMVARQQLADLRDGIRPSNRIETKALDRDEQRHLKDDLHRLATIVGDIENFMS